LNKHIITEDDILAVPEFKLPIFRGNQCEALRMYMRKLLIFAHTENNDNECGFLIDSFNFNLCKTFKGTETDVRMGDTLLYVNNMPEYDNRYIFIHNHPNNSGFSFTDIKTFMLNNSIFMAIAVQNNGSFYLLYKTQTVYKSFYDWVENNFSSPAEFCKACPLDFIHFYRKRRIGYNDK
jgi:hypothetical protein